MKIDQLSSVKIYEKELNPGGKLRDTRWSIFGLRRHLLESARIVYKSLNGDASSYMSDMFTKVNVSTTRSLRNSDYDLRVPFLRTTTGQRCFSYQGAKLWNGLSKKTKDMSTLKNFMKAIK